MKPKILIAFFILICAVLLLCSCNESEIATSDVKETDAYMDLQTDYEELSRKYEKIKSKYDSLNVSDDATSYKDLIDGIAKSTFVKLACKKNVTDATDIEISNEDILSRLKVMLSKSIKDNKTKLSALAKEEGYVYTAFRDDNSIMAFTVYDNDRVVFYDMPKVVFYCQGAAFIGRAYFGDGSHLDSLEVSVPEIMYDADICYLDEALMSADAREAIAFKLNKALGKIVKDEVDEYAEVAPAVHGIMIYYLGRVYDLGFYEDYIEISEGDESIKYEYKDADYESIFK